MLLKVSVIVPIYKAEAYLQRCINSLLTQTLKDFELLLIDDGSPDRSGNICDEYAQQDPRIRVIHKENGGVGLARQTGLEAARGEYVIHADPDDWVEPNMLEELYAKAKEESADMVICDYYENSQGVDNYISQKPRSLQHNDLISELFHGTQHGSCWNKLVRHSAIVKTKSSFPRLSLCEDAFFIVSLLKSPINVVYLNKAFYHYNKNNVNSVTSFVNPVIGRYAFEYTVALKQLLSDYPQYWHVFRDVCMGGWAYISLYYGNVSRKEYSEAYGDLRQVDNLHGGHLRAKDALDHWYMQRFYFYIRRLYSRLRKNQFENKC